MKIFGSKKERAEKKKARAKARQMVKIQKLLTELGTLSAQGIDEDIKGMKTAAQEFIDATEQVLLALDEEIQIKQTAGEDVAVKLQNRDELAQNLEEMRQALKNVPDSPFSTAPAEAQTSS